MKNGNTKQPEEERQSRDTKGLARKSRDELIRIILRLEARLNRYESDTAEFEETRMLVRSEAYAPNLATLTFQTGHGSVAYHRLPASMAVSKDGIVDTMWRVLLVSSDTRHRLLALEIYDDVTAGRTMGGMEPDLDLADWNAEMLGVSRRHALIRPTRRSLFLIDLGSKNGTYCNGVRLSAGQAHRLAERDIVSFGKLHFMLERVIQPTAG